MNTLNDYPQIYISLDKNDRQQAMTRVYQRGDYLMKIAVVAHLLIALILAFFYNTWWLAIGVGCIVSIVFFASAYLLPGSFITRCVASVVFQLFLILFIYQLHGMSEMHFFFFTAMTILIVYQDWVSLLPGLAVILVHHVVFATLHNLRISSYFFQEDYISYTKLVMHFGIVVAQAVICCFWAYLLSKQTLREAHHRLLLSEKSKTIESTNRQLAASLEDAKSVQEELRQQAENMKLIQEELEHKQQQIARYNTELELKIRERTHDLQQSLDKSMSQEKELKKISEELQIRQQQMEARQQLESSLTQLDDLMRLNYSKSFDEFADKVALFLAHTTKAMRIVVFCYVPQQGWLKAIGGYACTPKTLAKSEFLLGEGLVGQAAKNREAIILNNLPARSVRVPSSLADIENKHVIITPLVYNEQLQGVIELSGIEHFNEQQQEFLQRASRNIATVFMNISISLHTQKLLTESQETMIQIQSQEEELRQNLEELEATQEELRRREEQHLREIERLKQLHENNMEELRQKNRLLNQIREEIGH